MRPAATLDHVTITATDFAASAVFYDGALGALGLERVRELVDEEEDAPTVEALAWGVADEQPLLWLVHGGHATSGAHLRLLTQSHVQVETFHHVAVASGGTSHLEPRRWTPYRRGEFQAIVRDPAGNLIEACCPE